MKPHPAVAQGFITEWLVCGPFPKKGPFPSGKDAFYTDYLKDAGGEGGIEPKAGLTHSIKGVEGAVVQWQEYNAEENGFVNFVKIYGERFVDFWRLKNGVAYAFTRIISKEARMIVFVIGSEDSIQIWLNGRLIHHNRIGRSAKPGDDVVVAELQKGVNRLLVKVARYAGGWGFFLQRFDVEGEFFVNKQNVLLPDLRIGEKMGAWGYVSLVNTFTEPLDALKVGIKENDLFVASTAVVSRLEPGEPLKVAFWLATKREVAPGDGGEVMVHVECNKERRMLSLKARVRKRDEFFVRTYRSRVDDSVQPYGLLLPASYDEAHPYPLVVTLHGYKGRWIIGAYAQKEWCIIAAPLARGEVPYREIGAWDVFEVIESVKSLYNIDEDRIYLTGHSMGGFGSWHLGLRHPDLFAAIAPSSSSADYRLRIERVKEEGERVPEFAVRLLEESSPILFAENALNLPIFVSHGSEDKVVNVESSRRIVTTFKELDYEVNYNEVPGKPHWSAELADSTKIFNFFQKHKRNPNPKDVVYCTNSLRFNRAYWVAIDELVKLYKMGKIHGKVYDGNRLDVTVENISRFTLDLNDKLVDLSKPLAVNVNGSRSYFGMVPRSGKMTFRAIFAEDGSVKKYSLLIDPKDLQSFGGTTILAELDESGRVKGYSVLSGEKPLRKRPGLFGPIIDAFNHRFLLVYGAKGEDAKEIETNKRAACQTALWWRSWANGNCHIKPDSDVSFEDLKNYNLILYGNPSSNSLVEQINDQLPIRFESGGAIVMPGQRFTGRNVSLMMIYPNPLNPERYVVVNAGTTWRGVENFHKLTLNYVLVPDYVIFEGDFTEKGWESFLAAGFFDKNWQLED